MKLSKSKIDLDIQGSFAALKRAAKRARELAIQTGTYLHVSQNGKPVALNPVTMKPVQYPERQRRE